MKAEDFFKSKILLLTAAGLGAVLALALVFSVGVMAGQEKARFSYRWNDDNFRRAAVKNMSAGAVFLDRGYFDGHGAIGAVTNIESGRLTLKGLDGNEKNVSLGSSTVIRLDEANIKPGDLKVNDHVVVIGSPENDGSIDARLIRVLDDPGEGPLPF
jgi:Domain of unknown function (DUF5666)